MSTTAATTVKGDEIMAYETKVLLIAIANIIRKSNCLEDVYKAIEEMANAEGIVLKPLDSKEGQN